MSSTLAQHVFKKVFTLLSADSKQLAKTQNKQGIKASPLVMLDGKKYQANIRDTLDSILLKVLKQLEKKLDNEFEIGIFHLRSSLLYYDGRIPIYFGKKWGEGKNRISNIHEEDEINRFLWQPESDTPIVHLLELITRSKHSHMILSTGNNNTSDISSLALTKSVDAIKTKLLSEASSPAPVMQLLFQLIAMLDDTEIQQAVSVLCIDKTMIEKALVNPVRVMAKYGIRQLIYLPLSPNTGGVGAFEPYIDGGVVFSTSNSILDSSFLNTISAFFRENFAVPLLSAETYWRKKMGESQDKTYVHRFYKKGETLKNIIAKLHDTRENPDLSKDSLILFEHVEDILQNFYTKPIRGLESITNEILASLSKLWKSWNIVKKNSKDSSLLDLLTNLLSFENRFNYVLPNYREHFIHSFHVLLLGMLVVSTNKAFSKWRKSQKFWKAWFMTALFHDIGIPVAKSPDAVGGIINKDFQLTNLEKTLKPEVAWYKLLVERDFHMMPRYSADELHKKPSYLKYSNSKGVFKIPNSELSLALSSLIATGQLMPSPNQTAYEHAVISGLLLYKHSISAIYEPSWSKAIKAAVLPAMLHHAWEKRDFEVRTKQYKPPLTTKLICDPQKGFLLFLLVLCDAISQAGRDFSSDINPAQGIKLDTLELNDDQTIVVLDYTDFPEKETLPSIWEKYVKKALEFFTTNATWPVILKLTAIGTNINNNLDVSWTYPSK